MMRARLELFGLQQRASEDEDEWNDGATDKERNAPPPGRDLVWRHPDIQTIAECGGDHDRDLLARRLPTGIEALVAGRRHFREIDRYATQLSTSRKSLQQAAGEHQQRRRQPDR